MEVSIQDNIDSLKEDIEDRKQDLEDELRSKVGRAMRGVLQDAAIYLNQQSSVSGDLLRSLSMDTYRTERGFEFDVNAGGSSAPYAAVVEYGSGRRSNIWYERPGTGLPVDNAPADYPFEGPDIQNPSGFAYYIEQWMRKKGITPDYGSYRASALAITKTMDDLGTFAHPFMRPAWIENELEVRQAARNAVRAATR